MSIVTELYSDIALHDPPDYYGGYKEPRVEQWGVGERSLSDPVSGAWRGSQYTMRWSDQDRKHREILSNEPTRYLNTLPVEVYCTSRANRAAKGRAWPVFVGPIIDMQAIEPLSIEVTLGDFVSQGLLSDRFQTPWRRVGDGGAVPNLSLVAEDLDLDTPEPTVYGINLRVPEIDVPSPQGYCIFPTYLGQETIAGVAWHCWLVAGHACASIPTIRVDGIEKIADEGSQWMVPHHPAWTAQFVVPYRDLTSRFGNPWRYTLVYGRVTNLDADPALLTDPDACALGHKQLTVAVEGVEPTAEGLAPAITDRIQQYKHWLINYVANRGPNSYQSGAWLTNPLLDLEDGPVRVVDEDSFDAASATGLLRLPPDGYVGAVVIGARAGERKKVTDYIAAWNRSCSVRFGVNHFGQFFVCMLSPTSIIKATAKVYTDQYDILENRYSTHIGWQDAQANRIPFKGDYNYATGVATTTGIAEWEAAITQYGREILGEERDYPMAPGITALYNLAHLEVLALYNPPRRIGISTDIGPDSSDDSLGYRELGDYICYKNFSSVSDTVGQIRLGQIEKMQIVGDRTVYVQILDVDDLIGFDSATGVPGPPVPGIFGPIPSQTQPPGSIVIEAGSTTASRQVLINANPEGATFYLLAGIHTANGNNTPKTGQTFVGEYGAIIDGTGWVSSNPDDGAFQALNVNVDNVTVQNLIIRNMPQKGVKSWHNFSSGWVIDHCEIHDCLYGIELSPSNLVSNCYIHHNISTTSPNDPNPNLRGGGVIGEFCDNAVLDNNEISFNGSETKWLEASGIICRSNYVHDNHENGLWYDTCTNALVENNICQDNGVGAGIFIEACAGTNVIRNNTSSRNHSGILLSTSKNCDVYGNTFDSNNYDIALIFNFLVISVDHDLTNNTIHGNTIRTPGNYAASLDHVSSGDTSPYVSNSKNNTLSNNTYYGVNNGGTWWYWEGNKTWTQWQAVPQDSGSTLL